MYMIGHQNMRMDVTPMPLDKSGDTILISLCDEIGIVFPPEPPGIVSPEPI